MTWICFTPQGNGLYTGPGQGKLFYPLTLHVQMRAQSRMPAGVRFLSCPGIKLGRAVSGCDCDNVPLQSTMPCLLCAQLNCTVLYFLGQRLISMRRSLRVFRAAIKQAQLQDTRGVCTYDDLGRKGSSRYPNS